MIAELSATHRTTRMFRGIAQRLTGRVETRRPRASFLAPFIKRVTGRTNSRIASSPVRKG
jgi:pilus assembly protein CpaE